MGRIYASNIFGTLTKIKEKEEKQGFSLNQQISINGFSFLTYFKKKVHFQNSYVEKNNFCLSAGTLIYKGKKEIEALKDILIDFDGDIDKIRKKILGNYVVMLKQRSKVYVFVDKYNIYNVFYRLDNMNFTLSSDIMDVILSQDNCNISENNLLLESFQCSPYGKDTFIRGISKLLGRQYIEINTDKGAISIKDIPYDRVRNNYNSIEDAAKVIADRINANYSILGKVFGNDIGINMTGGLDSRTVLAGCVSAGIRPQLIHAQSNSLAVTGTEIGDLQSVESIALSLGIKVNLLNWNCDYPNNFSKWNDLFQKYGFDYKFYGGNPNFFNSYEYLENCPSLLETGLFGECMRIREQYSEKTEPFASAEDFINEYQISGTNSRYLGNSDVYSKSQELKIYMIMRFKQELKAFGFNPEGKITMDRFEEIRYIHHRSTDAVLINFLNQLTGCMSVLGCEQVCEYIYDTKKEYRNYGALQLRIIENLSPALVHIPFFSHCRKCTVNKKKYMLIRKKEFNEKIGEILRHFGLKDSLFYIMLRKMKYVLFKSNSQVQHDSLYAAEIKNILPKVIESITQDQCKIGKIIDTDSIPEDDSLIHIIYYAMNIRGLRLLKEGKSF